MSIFRKLQDLSDVTPSAEIKMLAAYLAAGHDPTEWFHPDEFRGFFPRKYPFRLAKTPRSIEDFAVFKPEALREMAQLLRQEARHWYATPRYTELQAEMRAVVLEQLADKLTANGNDPAPHLPRFHGESPFTFLNQVGYYT